MPAPSVKARRRPQDEPEEEDEDFPVRRRKRRLPLGRLSVAVVTQVVVSQTHRQTTTSLNNGRYRR